MQGYVVSQHGWGIPTVPQLSWAQETLHLWQTHARTKWFILCEHWADIAQFYNYYITRTLLGVIKSKYSQTGENQTPTKPNTRCAGRLHCVSLCDISNDMRFTRQTSKPLPESVTWYGASVHRLCHQTTLRTTLHLDFCWLLDTHFEASTQTVTSLLVYLSSSEQVRQGVCVGAFGACVSAHPCFVGTSVATQKRIQ